MLGLGHHHPWSPDSGARPAEYFGISPDDSERLVAAVARQPRILGYAAGHTHRNRVRRFRATGHRPWIEVACVKAYRSEEHTSELQSLMRLSYAVFCLKKKKKTTE